jgi:hypothetical protein
MRNQRKVAALVVVALAALIATGGLVASNMGFKLNYLLLDATDAGSNSGTQSIGLPYNRQVGIDDASELFRDIGLTISTCGKNPCNCLDNLQRYDTATDNNQPYACATLDFALTPGEGLLVKTLNTLGGDYIVVGSHNPALTINLVSALNAGSNSGTGRYTHPYHGVSALASELISEMGGCGFVDRIANIQKFDPASDNHQPYTCGLTDYAIEPGQAYLVKTGTGAPASGIDFVPAHY